MSAGKGDSPRKVCGDRYRENYDDIFRPEWPDLIGAGLGPLEGPYVFDGPTPKRIPPREFMKTNTEGDE